MTTTLLTVAEAARATGRTAGTMRQLCRRGSVPGAVLVHNPARRADEWRVPAAWANDPANRNRGPGQPPRADSVRGRRAARAGIVNFSKLAEIAPENA